MLCECISRWGQQSEPRGSQAVAGVCRERFLPIPTEKSASAYLCRSFKRTLGDQGGKKDGDVEKGDQNRRGRDGSSKGERESEMKLRTLILLD